MVTVNDVKDVVCEFYKVSPNELVASRKNRDGTAICRQVAYWLAKEYTTLSYPSLGRIFMRDHTTIIHGVRAIEQRRQTEPRVYMALTELRRRLDAKHHRGGRLLDGNDSRASGE